MVSQMSSTSWMRSEMLKPNTSDLTSVFMTAQLYQPIWNHSISCSEQYSDAIPGRGPDSKERETGTGGRDRFQFGRRDYYGKGVFQALRRQGLSGLVHSVL